MRWFITDFLLVLSAATAQAAGPVPDTQLDPAWREAVQRSNGAFQQHHYSQAAEAAKQALRIARHFDPDDDRLAATYFQLSSIHRDWGHCTEAVANDLRAIAIWERQKAPSHQFAFNGMINLISTYCECNRVDDAEKSLRVYLPRLQAYRTGPLDDHQILAMRAVLARYRKRYRDAETYYREAIHLSEQTPGGALAAEREHANLAVVLRLQNRHAESLAEAGHAIAFFEKTGMQDPASIAALDTAACAFADLGRKMEAKQMFSRALAAAQGLFGDDHRVTGAVMLNYARLLRENHDSAAASAMKTRGEETSHRALLRERSLADIGDLGR